MVHEIVGRINGHYGTLTHVPIHHLDRQLSFHELCALYAITDVALVTSLRDGMNLVSYEYVACQSDNAGKLPAVFLGCSIFSPTPAAAGPQLSGLLILTVLHWPHALTPSVPVIPCLLYLHLPSSLCTPLPRGSQALGALPQALCCGVASQIQLASSLQHHKC